MEILSSSRRVKLSYSLALSEQSCCGREGGPAKALAQVSASRVRRGSRIIAVAVEPGQAIFELTQLPVEREHRLFICVRSYMTSFKIHDAAL